jgi:hypothetical protein
MCLSLASSHLLVLTDALLSAFNQYTPRHYATLREQTIRGASLFHPAVRRLPLQTPAGRPPGKALPTRCPPCKVSSAFLGLALPASTFHNVAYCFIATLEWAGNISVSLKWNLKLLGMGYLVDHLFFSKIHARQCEMSTNNAI